ncbi:PTS mannitol transporter subunit IICBA [Fusibacter paucivorans]|uniref:Mannitol-specific phosphotransferase enzyme IIA component n=1 Tax=Fusibacter paucivorans TaxID=76009 RepID=A0ABS5PMC9_9FIRM|nr:PTS mannitol transporter subunit IICBA [Fusibacter paucivorans]MBS7525559.1 PTS mannitol transporter subunit IICBA [Fusibacter paucivorans]
MTSKLQRIGRFLSRMVMPNISAFIAWGIITTLFNPDGWFPSTAMNMLVVPLMIYALPSLVAYAGGQHIYGHKGGIIAVVGTMGVIIGTQTPMFVGAMIMGPISAYLLKRVDGMLKRHTPIGFEMLMSNFTAGVLGTIMIILGYVMIGPIIGHLNALFKLGVDFAVSRSLLFLAAIFIEPGKVLFLNNAINHGILTPLGLQQSLAKGDAIFFLLETNPGPGIGILAAYWVNGRGSAKLTAPGALIIHALGGIHEIYFPYVMMYPVLFVSVIIGGLVGDFIFQLFDSGLVAMASPGSLLAILALAPKNKLFGILLGIIGSSVASFLSAGLLIARRESWEMPDHDEMAFETDIFKGYQGNYEIAKIVFACDAGMGSSAMGASLLQKMLRASGVNVLIENVSLDDIPEDASAIITFNDLLPCARQAVPGALYIGIKDFLDRAYYEALIDALLKRCHFKEVTMNHQVPDQILMKSNIILDKASVSKEEAIRYAGQLLVESGYVEANYIEGMLAREEKFTTFIGNGVAIPHGENAVKDSIIASGIVVVQYPNGIDFGSGNIAKLVIGIAGKGNEHLQILSNVAEAIEEDELLNQMLRTKNPDTIYDIFAAEGMLAQ